MDEFVAHNSRWRLALLVLASVGFVAVGLWMGGAFGAHPSSRRYSPGAIWGVGWFCVVFFGMCGCAWVKRIFDTGAQLQIGRSGIRWSPWSGQIIPWSEVADVTTCSIKQQQFIVLHLRHPERFPSAGLKGKLQNTNRMITGGDIVISLTGTDRSFSDAMSAISHFRG